VQGVVGEKDASKFVLYCIVLWCSVLLDCICTHVIRTLIHIRTHLHDTVQVHSTTASSLRKAQMKAEWTTDTRIHTHICTSTTAIAYGRNIYRDISTPQVDPNDISGCSLAEAIQEPV
jgi:uncharacterized membrane protein YcgQ (UPF0703/DUF1980 family)